MNGAFYLDSITCFLSKSDNEIFAQLTTAHLKNFSELDKQQEKSWKKFIKVLKKAFYQLQENNILESKDGLLLEYKIPRRDKRVDCVLIAGSAIIVVEFKLWDKTGKAGRVQLEDYCLDLRDFHRESRDKKIYPILLASGSKGNNTVASSEEKLVQTVISANENSFSETIEKILDFDKITNHSIDFIKWNNSAYSPTPTIIEAVKTLYKGQNVEEITRHHAGIENLNKTTQAVVEAIRDAKKLNSKIICFITGVPGAGKTLAGLNIAHLDEFQFEDFSLATFLSGNVPLINVLREALKRDVLKKYKRSEKEAKENEVVRISTFIEKVHTFIDTYYFKKNEAPNNKILIFDEAQRAWNKEHKTKKSEGTYTKSEPHILFEIMNRHKDWCAIIALIGGGQEINTGESGLEEWGKAIITKFKNWKIHISPFLLNNEYTAHKPLFKSQPRDVTVIENENLHLSVSIRSYNAEKLSDWVNAVLNIEPERAYNIFQEHLSGYPIYLTRSLEDAKAFLKTKRLGTRRVGLVASSGGRRLRAHGIDVDIALNETQWFLNSTEDVRSSNFLEIAGKDFKIQGLELDWTCVCWDADFYLSNKEWNYQAFGGTKWNEVKKDSQKQFIKNKYRVLLTRAREGMIIWIPTGDVDDITRNINFYNSIFQYFLAGGIEELNIFNRFSDNEK